MASIRQQINFEHWAEAESLAAIVAARLPVPEALAILAHTIAISNFWAARVEGTSERLDRWPILSPSGLETRLSQVRDRWLELATSNTLNAEVCYQSSKGDICSNRFDEVLQEVFMHGAHHRGQIAMVLRLKGFEPPSSTDFIPALRNHGLL